MVTHDPRFAFYFVHGMYDRLFALYRNYQEHHDFVSLVATGANDRTWWAVLKPSTNRIAEVLWSNFLFPGSIVRSAIPFAYAKRPRQFGTIQTRGNPRHLTVIRVPHRSVASFRPQRIERRWTATVA